MPPHPHQPECGKDRYREAEGDEPIGWQPSGDERDPDTDEREEEPRAKDPPGIASGGAEPRDREGHRDPLDVSRPAVDEPVAILGSEFRARPSLHGPGEGSGLEVGRARSTQERILRRVYVEPRRAGPNRQQTDPEKCAAGDRCARYP